MARWWILGSGFLVSKSRRESSGFRRCLVSGRRMIDLEVMLASCRTGRFSFVGRRNLTRKDKVERRDVARSYARREKQQQNICDGCNSAPGLICDNLMPSLDPIQAREDVLSCASSKYQLGSLLSRYHAGYRLPGAA